MFEKLLAKFKKNNEVSKKANTDVKRAEIEKIEIEKTEVEKAEVERTRLKIRFRDVTTGEISEIDMFDHEAFNKMMSNKNNQLILG